MIKVNGFNLYQTKADSVTFNGSHITASILGKEVKIRTIANKNWYDEKHVKVMESVEGLEKAIRDLLEDE